MARHLNMENVKRDDVMRVYPEDLIVDVKKRGRAFPPTQEQVEIMAADIKERGQLQPVPVTVTHAKKLELMAGFTRWEAFMLLNSRSEPGERRRIECIIRNGNEEESFLNNIAENRIRNIATVIDDAHNIRRLSEQFHKTDEEICAIYADAGRPKSPAWLIGMRKLLGLSRPLG